MKIWELLLILFLVISIMCIFRFDEDTNIFNIETFNPYLDYSRLYPGIAAFKPGYGPYYNPVEDIILDYRNYQNDFIEPRNLRYNPGYFDYWYIPAHNMLNRWINGVGDPYNYPTGLVNGTVIPPLVDQNCINSEIQKTGNLDLAVFNCTIPATIVDDCYSYKKS